MDEVSWQGLGGIAGASVAAGVVVQAVKVYWPKMSRQASRVIAMTVGLVAVLSFVTVTNLSGGLTAGEWVGLIVTGLLVGLQAGLAASKVYEVSKDGLDHVTTASRDL